MLSYNYQFPNQTHFYQGKVRNVYQVGNKHLVMIATDRISAFDVILPKPIPSKGAILNTIAGRFLSLTKHIVPNWLLSMPDARASIGLKCEPIKIEMVVRGYLCGHALRTYQSGKRELCGAELPEGMKPYQKFAKPIITPSTKADEGHDMDISPQEIIISGLVSEEIYAQLAKISLALFNFGSQYAHEKGLILADTKYEFGFYEGQLYLMDEIHTPDSSRYFYQTGFEDCVANGQSPKQLSKEFVREWLISEGFMGREGEKVPEMTPEIVSTISMRYLELYQQIMGEAFDSTQEAQTDTDLLSKINQSLLQLKIIS